MELLRRRGIQSKPASDPRELLVCCPFCVQRGTTPDTKFRLGVRVSGPDAGLANCFNCRYKSRNALDDLKLALPQGLTDENAAPKEVETDLPADYEPLKMRGGGHWHKTARRYLLDRRVTPEQIRKHEAGLSLAGRAHHRIVFPIRSGKKGKLIGWTARTITEATPKYLHSHGLKDCYVASSLRDGGKSAVVLEGLFDALAVSRAMGYRIGSVALLGTHLTVSKYKALAKYRDVVLWLDPDDAGVKSVGRLAPDLVDRGHRVRFVMSSEDPGDMKDRAIREALASAAPWTDSAQNAWMLEQTA